MKRSAFACLTLALPLLPLAPIRGAHAQINPFGWQLNQRSLTSDDLTLLFNSTERLNESPSLNVGAANAWSNQQTGSSGTTTVTRIYQSDGMPCHDLRYALVPRGRQPPRIYDITWCRIPSGEWKIKS
jgi:hypothetical protein